MKPKIKTKLIGSAGSLNKLINAINERWHWDVEPVCELSETLWLLCDKKSKKFIPKVRIKKLKNRYRFEMEES